MSNDLILIEEEVFEEMLESHLAFQQLMNPICGYVLNQIDWKQVENEKKNILDKYITIPVNLDEKVVDKLEERGYK